MSEPVTAIPAASGPPVTLTQPSPQASASGDSAGPIETGASDGVTAADATSESAPAPTDETSAPETRVPNGEASTASYSSDDSANATTSDTTAQASTDEQSTDGENGVNICTEIVPEERQVDGIPAYSQCESSESSGVWSADGILTSAVQEGDWRRTQWGGGYQCTEFASRYMYFVWGVTAVPNGNAGAWCDTDPPEGLVQAPTPVHGDLIVFAPGSCGASDETGHVAVVDVVDEVESRVVIVEQNRAGRRSTDIDCAACFLHAVANDSP